MDCAVDGEDDGFEGNHAADLSSLDAGGAEDSDFAGAFADGEEQCVDDSQDCDDHCQGEQSVDDAEQLVDLGAEASAEFIFGFHLDDEEGATASTRMSRSSSLVVEPSPLTKIWDRW